VRYAPGVARENEADRAYFDGIAADALELAYDAEHRPALAKLDQLRGASKWERLATVVPRIRESVQRGLAGLEEAGLHDAIPALREHDRAYALLLLAASVGRRDGAGALAIVAQLAPAERDPSGLWAETARRLLGAKAPAEHAMQALDRARALAGDSDEHLLGWAFTESKALELLGREEARRALWSRVLRVVEVRKPLLRREDEGRRVELAQLERWAKKHLA
jgi:hypothetical protein